MLNVTLWQDIFQQFKGFSEIIVGEIVVKSPCERSTYKHIYIYIYKRERERENIYIYIYIYIYIHTHIHVERER